MRYMTNAEEKNLISTFRFDVEDYIKKNGKVCDKKTAIELLSRTNIAWCVLDESLRHDPEVIMYYQPMGYREFELSVPDNGEILNLGINFTGNMTCREIGFDWINRAELVENKYVGSEFGISSEYLIPKITFPEGFDYEAYFKIQDELKMQNPYVMKNESLSGMMKTIVKAFFCVDNREGYGWLKRGTTIIYDRNLLKALVPAIYKPEKVKTIGTHPSA